MDDIQALRAEIVWLRSESPADRDPEWLRQRLIAAADFLGPALERLLQRLERLERDAARPREKIAFMDGIDWQEHVEHDPRGAAIYATVEDVLKYRTCVAKGGCGVVRVAMREMDWPVEQNLRERALPDRAETGTPGSVAEGHSTRSEGRAQEGAGEA